MQLKIPHKFTNKETAIAKVKAAIEEARPKLGEVQGTIDEERWEGDVLHFAFTAQGQSVSGTLTVEDNQFDVYAKLPLMLSFFESKIEAAILAQSKQLLG